MAIAMPMRRALIACAALMIVAGCAAPPQAPAEPPPSYTLRDFFRNPDRASFRLSEDGRWLGFLQPATGDGGPAKRMNLFVQRLEGSRPVGEPRQLSRESARDIRNYFWKGSDTLLFTKDFGGDENDHVVAVDASGRITDLTPHDKTRAGIVDDLRDDADHILVQHNQRDKRAFDVYRVNVKTGAQTLLATNPGNIIEWTTDHAARLRLAVASDGVNNTVLHRAREGDAFAPIISTDFRTQVGPLFFDFDNKRFYANSNRGRDKSALVLIDPAKPDVEQLVHQHPQVDLGNASYSRERKVLTEADYMVAKPERHLFDPVMKRTAKNLACIVNPHGGPWWRDSWGFNSEVQFLASRGYCVLQMNFRGSTGYGRSFWEASFGQWGLKMQDDVSDGAKWLVAQGIADPKRIGIYGGSYGGYATLAGATFTPELYAAAVDYVGVSNLFTFMNTIPPYWEPFRQQMFAMVGHPERDKVRLAATSPALHADKITVPLFVAQGAKDPRVNKAESDQIVDALKKRGVEVQYLVKDNEGHGFANEENRFEFYEAMEAFFRRHLKP